MFEPARQQLEAALADLRDREAALVRDLDEVQRAIGRAESALTALGGAATRRAHRHSGKYVALFEYLQRHTGSSPIRMSFGEIEDVLGFKLPASSRRHLPHWHSYDGSAVVRAIHDAGWRARNVDLEGGSAEFHEVKPDDSS